MNLQFSEKNHIWYHVCFAAVRSLLIKNEETDNYYTCVVPLVAGKNMEVTEMFFELQERMDENPLAYQGNYNVEMSEEEMKKVKWLSRTKIQQCRSLLCFNL